MTKKQKDKLLGYSIFSLLVICYIGAIVSHDIPSYEQDSLEGAAKLLHWGVVAYLPLFPLSTGIFAIIISNTVTAIAVTTTNFLLTLVFTIFAYSSSILSTSWTFLLIASFIVAFAAHFDKHNSVRIDNKKELKS